MLLLRGPERASTEGRLIEPTGWATVSMGIRAAGRSGDMATRVNHMLTFSDLI